LDPLTRDALAWIVRLKSGEATLTDAEELMDWRARSPAHESAFRDAVRCWQAIGPAMVDQQLHPTVRQRRKTKNASRS
jgi:transmembrane sensor